MVLKGWTSFMMFLSSICLLKLQYNKIYPKYYLQFPLQNILTEMFRLSKIYLQVFIDKHHLQILPKMLLCSKNQNKQEIIIQINTKMQILNYNNRRGNKENENASPQKQMLKMKIQLNDCIFEYHKLEEDYAQEKAKLMMEFQRERVGLNRTVKELREKNVADNQQWTKKIDQIRKQKEQALASLTSFYEQEMQRRKEIITQQASIQFKREIESLKNQNQKIRNDLQNYQIQWKKQKQQMAANFKITLKRREQEKQNAFNSFLEGMKSQYQQKILSLQRLYIKEEQLLKQTQKQLFDKIEQHVKQTLQLQTTIRHYKHQNQELAKEVLSLEQTLKLQKENFENTLLKKAQSQNLLKATHAKELQKIKEQFQNKLEMGIQNHSKQIAKFKEEIVKLQKIYKQKQQIWEERGKKVLELFQKRESKKQDLKTIQSLQIELLKKDFMIQRQKKQLKNCKLELQNMQEIYDKMFISNAHLSKLKSKSFKVKKLKTSCLMNSSNRSTVIQIRRMSTEDK